VSDRRKKSELRRTLYEFNKTAEIEYLIQISPENEKNCEKLIIQRSSIVEIPENLFQDISFNYVEILKEFNAFSNITHKEFYIFL
jgi:hypothetical protein